MRPEAKLILECCASSLDAARVRHAVPLVGAGFEWDYFERLVYRNSVTPMVSSALKGVPIPDAGKEVTRRLAIAAQANELRNRHLVDELTRVLARFEATGIVALAFKGPTLAAMAYDDIALRAFSDLDILVHSADMKRAVELLVADGYGMADGAACRVDPEFFTAFDSSFETRRGADLLDLHWRIRRHRFHFFPDDEQIWARSIVLRLGSRRVRTFAPAELALYICVHGTKHGWASLQMIADIAHLVARCRFSVEEVLGEAQRIGSSRMVMLALVLANEMLGAPVAPVILERARADVAVEGAKKAIVHTLFSAEEIEHRSENNRRIATRLMNPADRARYWWWRAVTPTMGDREFIPLPRRGYPAYFVIRPVRLALQFVRSRTQRKAGPGGAGRAGASELKI